MELTSCSSGLTPGSQRAMGLSCSSSGKDPLSSKAWVTTNRKKCASHQRAESGVGRFILIEITAGLPLEVSLVIGDPGP